MSYNPYNFAAWFSRLKLWKKAAIVAGALLLGAGLVLAGGLLGDRLARDRCGAQAEAGRP